MRTGLVAAVVIGIAAVGCLRAEAAKGWKTDFRKAAKEAKESGKYMLLDFSGSDWCGWCVRLDQEVFSKQEFKAYATKNLVCVLLDFPRRKPQSKELKRQNQALMKKHGVRGFPTIIILSPTGQLVARTGYRPGGPGKYVEHLKAVIEPHKAKVKKTAKAGEKKAPPIRNWGDCFRQPDDWWKTKRAKEIADSVLDWQQECGGWTKGVDMYYMRKPGVPVKPDAREKKSRIRKTTFDNGATHSEMRFLARMFAATKDERYKAGVRRGVDFIFKSQYASGGIPQTPHGHAYTTLITFNDDVMASTLAVLKDIAERRKPLDWLDEATRAKSAAALKKGIDCILKCQIVAKGVRTAWGQQHDRTTFKPMPGRAYEPIAICTHESGGVVRLLMSFDKPSPEIKAAIHAAAAWFEKVKITGVRYKTVNVGGQRDYVVVKDPTAPPIWARFYEIGTNRAIFSDYDRRIRYNVAQISRGRRVGYGWLGFFGAKLLNEEYPAWARRQRRGDGPPPTAGPGHATDVGTPSSPN